MNLTTALDNSDGYWNDTAPTSVLVNLGNTDSTNPNGAGIAYCFTAKKGYSKFGGYTGNGQTDGSFIYTGFSPSFILVKRTEQINERMKTELLGKLEEFATYTDELEEVFENSEQIEVSKFYERLPKPWAIAVKELLADEVYIREVEKQEEEIPTSKSEEKKDA